MATDTTHPDKTDGKTSEPRGRGNVGFLALAAVGAYVAGWNIADGTPFWPHTALMIGLTVLNIWQYVDSRRPRRPRRP